MPWMRLKIIEVDGNDIADCQKRWPTGKGAKEEWAFNTDALVAWKGLGQECLLVLSTGERVKVAASHKVLELLTGMYAGLGSDSFK